ncbi:uncharacterized protein LOC119004709 [Acanthopagrus latus]|uniref:uncharacterized protein LOC119004709 n=1 Tax=Acanthopagrus latus TaxID=8177 RepID=UPI00187C7D6C|nr:uncharacterized protein LOC119004709 [Acanthopagrus latus]XP_036927772.1 uncharacterized protein LOC119004709 [Acanthopagrus latus]
MGSTGSRTGQRKVAPCNSLQEEGTHPKPQWTLPALPVTVEQLSGSLRQRKTTLPPLKQEIALSTLSEPCFAEGIPPKQSNNSSIIHSHPPRRPQALQPLALQIGHTGTANQIVMGRDCRGGDVHRFSTTGQTGCSGTGRMIQGGFLEAQTALTQQAHRHRRAHLRQAREQRRHKVVYTVNVGGPNTEGIQRQKLVRRPTERDIFWDDTTGESLDPSCLLDPKSLPHLCEERAEKRIQQTGHWGLSSWTNEREMVSVEDRGKTQRSGWMGPESARSSQTGRIRAAIGIWDHKLD